MQEVGGAATPLAFVTLCYCSGLAVCSGQAALLAFHTHHCQGSLDNQVCFHSPINTGVFPPPLLKGSGVVDLSLHCS